MRSSRVGRDQLRSSLDGDELYCDLRMRWDRRRDALSEGRRVHVLEQFSDNGGERKAMHRHGMSLQRTVYRQREDADSRWQCTERAHHIVLMSSKRRKQINR